MLCQQGCYELSVKCCNDVKVAVSLPANTTYTLSINIPGNHKVYQRDVITDNTGAFIIEKDLFPNGFLSCGYLEVEILNTDNTPQSFIINTIEYSCLLLELIDVDTDL